MWHDDAHYLIVAFNAFTPMYRVNRRSAFDRHSFPKRTCASTQQAKQPLPVAQGLCS